MKIPDNADLTRLLSDIADQYYVIGNLLGIKTGNLNSIKQSPMPDKVKLIQVFQEWKSAYVNVTWGKINEVLDIVNQETKEAVIAYLEKGEVRDRYLEKKDFAGKME